ncbi:DUF938 domain-containing protein [Methylibium sp.]|uniref:DUF938 domain-containing protein n=1 Tax=Methylibium sp. TaxID=2067992 RepID=UPI003D12CF54
MPQDDLRQHSPAADRNKQHILELLLRTLPAQGVALEIASGTGQHAVHFAAGLPGWTWQPTDADDASLASISAYASDACPPGLRAPLRLDVTAADWPGAPRPVDALYCANLLHIAPWAACLGLMRGAARHLSPQGLLITYGPYLVDGERTAPSNLAFDADLRRRDPAWGLRRLEDVAAAADAAGLRLRERVSMPANNLVLLFERCNTAAAGVPP